MRLAGRDGGLTGPLLAVLLVCSSLVVSSCRGRGGDANTTPPDSLLQASLGLSPDDRVYRITLTTRDGRELADPQQVQIEPGDYVEFFTGDGLVRTVSFFTDSLSAEQAEFLRSRGQDRSPPLVELESRFVVSFVDAPVGRYPFVVDGNQRPVRGAVTVGGEGRE